MSKQTYYAFAGAKSSYEGMAQMDQFQAGLTVWSPRRGTSSSPPEPRASLITIAYELVEPLLNPLLLPEDRALDNFRLAEDILHETAHAIGHQMVRMNKELDWTWCEPYFENEPIPELGFSATNHVFGGISLSVINPVDIKGYSSGGIILYNWPTYKHEFYTETVPVLAPEKQKDWENIKYWPIPVSFFMGLQCEEFWDIYVRKFGSKASQAGPKVIGVCQPKRWTTTILRHTTGTPGPEKKAPGFFSRRKTKVAHSFEAEKQRLTSIITQASKNVQPKVLPPRLPTGESGFQPIIGRTDRAGPVEVDCPSYSHAAYGVLQVNHKGWMKPTPPQQTQIETPPQPDQQLAEIFDFICRRNLLQVDPHEETRDMDTYLLKHYTNLIWKTEKDKKTNPKLLEYPDMPDGFTEDEAGEEIFLACIWHSPYFVDAPYRQGLARRADIEAPGNGPYIAPVLKNIHQSLTRGDPMRLGIKDILGDDSDETSA
ncbi:hypothetical protein ACHAO8_001473 [Botrytis cinerea]